MSSFSTWRHGALHGAVVGAAVVAATLVAAPPALAHSIGGTAADMNVWEFIPLGIEHMLLGWDHLLFIIGIVLLAGEWRRAAKLISVFVLGHSTTLIIATLVGWQVDATVVDIVIALSLVFVGVVGWFGRPRDWKLFIAAVLGFGLVHGLGLSTRLQDLGLPEEGLLWRVIVFNVGVEIGQLLAIGVLTALGLLVVRFLEQEKVKNTTSRAASVGLVAAGLVAAVVLTITSATSTDAEAAGSCSTGPTRFPVNGAGQHPDKKFYEPAEKTPDDDFGHVMGDGYVIVHYAATIPVDQVAALRQFITGPDGNRVVGGSAVQAGSVVARNAFSTLTCSTVDIPALKDFAKEWFADPRSRPAQG